MVFFSSRISPFTSTVIFLRQVAVGHGRRHVGDVAHLAGQVAGHEVDAVGQVLPRAGHAAHVGLAAELAFGADFAGHAGHFRGERAKLIHHRVDGVLQLENFALHIDGDLLATGRPLATAVVTSAMLRTWPVRLPAMKFTLSVRSFQVPATPSHVGLPAELAFGADFAGHAGHFGGERAKLIDHRVDGVFQLENFAFHVDGDLLGQVAVGHGGGHFGDVAHLAGQVAGHEVDAIGQVLPGAGDAAARRPGRRACLRCRLRGPRGSLPRRTS